MTKEELAKQLDRNAYGNEIDKDLEAQAKDAGLIIVFGASDDLMEFRGAIHDEYGCYNGGTAYLVDGALFEDDGCDCRAAVAYRKAVQERAKRIKAIWNAEGYSWIYETDIPHATFEIMEDDDEKYCRGIVFNLADLKGN